jgi:hypothetical protein
MSNEFITLTLTALEYQEQCTNIAHRTALMLHEKGYISEEDMEEITSSLIVTYVRNNTLLGKIRKLVFGESKRDDVANVVFSWADMKEFKND